MKKTCIIFLVLLLSSCANPYSQFYRGDLDARSRLDYEPVEGDVQIHRSHDLDRDILALVRCGYTPVGTALFQREENFNKVAQRIEEARLRKQANKVGAHVVLTAKKYQQTVSGVAPQQVPTMATSISTGTATAFGPRGVVNAVGTGTTTAYGSQTVMAPYSFDVFEHCAVFFAKTRSRVGIVPLPVDDATRKRLETNSGVIVLAVREGSPAFQADILPGDVLLSIGEDRVQSVENYLQLLDKNEGQTVSFHLDRNGKPVKKQIQVHY